MANRSDYFACIGELFDQALGVFIQSKRIGIDRSAWDHKRIEVRSVEPSQRNLRLYSAIFLSVLNEGLGSAAVT